MQRRELRTVATNVVVGAIAIDNDGNPQFERQATRVFEHMRGQADDLTLVTELLNAGWSNGYVYLAPINEPAP